MKRPIRKLRRRTASALFYALAGAASRGGPDRIRRVGEFVGRLHYALSGVHQRRLRHDMARALALDERQAAAVLRSAYRYGGRAVFEIICLAHRACDPDALIAPVRVHDVERLDAALEPGRGVVVLGMHMGNGLLMAARLARAGYPVHVVYRDPRRLPPGLLGRSLERAGCRPIALDRDNPTRSFREMMRVLSRGEMLYALMDQANKREGAPRTFLGKPLNMPSGVPALAVRTGAPVVPVHVEAVDDSWTFRVHEPLTADDADAMLDAMIASMEEQIRARPEQWAWHHRRWKRYHFPSDPSREPDACP